MASSVTVHAPTIGFRTKNDWNARDLFDLLSASSKIYNVFEAIDAYSGFRTHSIDFYEEQFEKYEVALSKTPKGQQYIELYKNWLQVFRRHLSDPSLEFPLGLQIPPLPPIGVNFQTRIFPESISQIYHGLSDEPVAGNLRIYRIKMASPGVISLSGFGDVIKEVREFIKDVWYRNKQEKTKGQLELIEQYLKMRSIWSAETQSQLESTYVAKELSHFLSEGITKIQSLEEGGLLDDVGKNLDYIGDR